MAETTSTDRVAAYLAEVQKRSERLVANVGSLPISHPGVRGLMESAGDVPSLLAALTAVRGDHGNCPPPEGSSAVPGRERCVYCGKKDYEPWPSTPKGVSMPDQREPMTTPATPVPLLAEAVEAAAKVHHRLHCNGPLPDGSQPCDREPKEQDKATARQMLEAAAPVLAAAERERILRAATDLSRSFQGDLRDLLRQEGGT